MDDAVCPRCRTTKYRNANLNLMVNVCGHALCENCVELLFVRGSGNCPVCNIPLRRINFRLQYFEDASIEKEIEIRKKILRDFNRKEDEFSTLREFNDYLEEVETIIHNLVNGIDVESTKRKIEQYKKDNKDLISKGRFKKSADEIFIETCLAEERVLKSQADGTISAVDKEKLEREKNQQLLIDDLMFSDAPAQSILQSHAQIQQLKATEALENEQEKPAEPVSFSSVQLGQATTFKPLVKKKDILYIYHTPEVDNLGPHPPTQDDIIHKGYLKNIRSASAGDKAGGYESHIGCMRALQSAVEGLFLSGPPQTPSPVPSSSTSSEVMDTASP